MSKLVVLADLHLQDYRPMHEAQKLFIDWFCSQGFNISENSLLQLGDAFHHYHSSPRTNSLAIDFFQNKMKFGKKYVLSGNYHHEIYSQKRTWAIDILEPIEGVHLFKKPETIEIGKLSVLMLPWYTRTMFPELGSMKDNYETLTGTYDFIFGHFSDVPLFGEEIEVSKLIGKKVLGHIHNCNFGESFLGTPYPVRKDEANKQNRIMIIDTETKEFEYIEIPSFIDYYDVTYPEPFDSKDKAEICILDVYNAPSREIVQDFYKEYYIRKNGIHLVKDSIGKEEGEKTQEVKSLLDYLNNYCVDKSIKEEQKQILFSVMGERD